MTAQYVMCVAVDDEYADDLILHKVYRVLSDALGDKAGMIRVTMDIVGLLLLSVGRLGRLACRSTLLR